MSWLLAVGSHVGRAPNSPRFLVISCLDHLLLLSEEKNCRERERETDHRGSFPHSVLKINESTLTPLFSGVKQGRCTGRENWGVGVALNFLLHPSIISPCAGVGKLKITLLIICDLRVLDKPCLPISRDGSWSHLQVSPHKSMSTWKFQMQLYLGKAILQMLLSEGSRDEIILE